MKQWVLPIYAKRLPSGLTQNDHSLILSEQRRSGRQLIYLTVSNPTECFADYPHASIKAALCEVGDYRYKPDPLGDRAAAAVVEAQKRVFAYHDMATTRSGIGAATSKLLANRIAIIGIGGTGAYILDLLAKVPIREIHIYDGDRF